jgi:hypothetical protein
MAEKDRLSRLILRHWQEHCPRMVEELRAHNLLANALAEATERTADLLYELVSVQKLEYRVAWEKAMQEWAYLPSEDP